MYNMLFYYIILFNYYTSLINIIIIYVLYLYYYSSFTSILLFFSFTFLFPFIKCEEEGT